MHLMRITRRPAGKCVSLLTATALLTATSGCGSSLLENTGDLSQAFGVLVNTDTSKDLIGGVRMRSGESVYVYGTFAEDGTVGEVRSAVFQNAAGRQATMHFESGRPRSAIGFDGSRLEIVYEEVSSARLKGQVIFSPAGAAQQVLVFDVDLQQTAEQVAALVEQLTGIEIVADPPPPASDASRPVTSEKQSRAARNAVVQVLIVPVVIAISGFTVSIVTSQLLEDMLRTADAVVETAILAFLTPFILMGNLMRMAFGMPLVTIGADQDGYILNIPRPEDF